MKNKIFSLMIGAVVALASCSKSDDVPTLPQSGEQLATFNIEAPATRAAVTGLSRYIVEAYEGKDLTTTPIRVEAATGSLTVALKKDTEYTFVFWADKGVAKTEAVASSGYWNTASLKAVAVSVGKEATVGEAAYCLAVSFNSKDFETKKAVILKNATSQINFVEAAGLTAAGNSLVVKYSSSNTLNVAAGEVTEVAGEVTHTFSNIAKAAKDTTIASDYLLAPLDEKLLLDVKVTFNAEEEKTIAAVPFQQSYKTNIKGEFSSFYSSVFTISNEVEDYTNNPEVEFPDKKLKVGSFYYSDNSWSNTIDVTKTCIGIVYVVNADGTTGKIVSLDEETKAWSTEKIDTGATSDTDGAANTTKVLAFINYIADNTKYPAFAWCATKNTTPPTGISWYIPAKSELLDGIYANKEVLNTSLTAAGATVLSDNWCWSSTQDVGLTAWLVNFDDGSTCIDGKYVNNIIRVVSAF